MSFDVQVTDAMVETAWRVIHKDTACNCRECIRKALIAALAQSDAEQILNSIGEALESRGYVHMTNGKSIGDLLDELEALRAQSDAEPVGVLHNQEAGFHEIVTRDTLSIYDNDPKLRLVEEIYDENRSLIGFRVYDALAQSNAEPDPNFPDPNFDPIEAAQVDAKSIEEANAQSDAEPKQEVRDKLLRAMERRRFVDEGGRYLLTQSQAFDAFTEVIAAYPALSHPDASVGLIDAITSLHDVSEAATRIVNRIWGQTISADAATEIRGICQDEIKFMRARAADRSGE